MHTHPVLLWCVWVLSARDRSSSCFQKVHKYQWTCKWPVTYVPGCMHLGVLSGSHICLFDGMDSSELCRKQNNKMGAVFIWAPLKGINNLQCSLRSLFSGFFCFPFLSDYKNEPWSLQQHILQANLVIEMEKSPVSPSCSPQVLVCSGRKTSGGGCMDQLSIRIML